MSFEAMVGKLRLVLVLRDLYLLRRRLLCMSVIVSVLWTGSSLMLVSRSRRMNGRRSCGSSQGIEIGISEALGLLVERVNAAAMLLDDTIAASRREVISRYGTKR